MRDRNLAILTLLGLAALFVLMVGGLVYLIIAFRRGNAPSVGYWLVLVTVLILGMLVQAVQLFRSRSDQDDPSSRETRPSPRPEE